MSDDSHAQAEPRVCEDMAERDFNRFGETMDLDFDKKHMDAEDKQGFDDMKRRIVEALKRGSLVINDNGCPEFTPTMEPDAKPIVFNEPTGAALKATDTKKKDHDVEKTLAFAAAITGENQSRFDAMKQRDLKVVLAITGLYLGG